MKKNFTIYALVCLVCSLTVLSANAQTTQYSFNASPTLIAGSANQVNAKYRFANVSAGVDAIVTIISATNGATVDIFDDNSITKPEGFSPKIAVPKNKTGLVEFQVCFVAAGTLNATVQDSLYATAIDIDGNATVKEIDVIEMGGGISSYQVGTPEITVTQEGSVFTGKNVTGIEYDGIDTSAKKVMFTVKNNNVGCFTYKCGATNTGNSAVSRQKSIYFKNFTYPPLPVILPVKYLSFEAASNNKAINIKWVTVEETNHSHYELERSFDKSSYKAIAVILDGFSNAENNKTYAYKDNSAEINGKKIIYYRLKQIDLDGKINYSNVVAVRMVTDAGIVMQVSPNPFTKQLSITFTTATNTPAEISIININGQPVMTKRTTVAKGANTIVIGGLEKLTPGIYMARLILNGIIVETQKVIK